MKNFLLVLVVVAGGLLAFNYFTTGELTLVPAGSKSEAEKAIRGLEKDFDAALKEFNQAFRGAAVGGLDTTGDVEGAMKEVDRVERELRKLTPKLASEAEKMKAKKLDLRIRQFKKDAW